MKEGNQGLEPCNTVGRNKLSVAANAAATLVHLSRKHLINKHYVNTRPKRITIQEKQQQLILKQQQQHLTLKLQQQLQQQSRQHLLNRIKENYKILQLNSLILVIILANLLVLLSANNKLGVLASPKIAFDSSEYNRDNQHERKYYDSAVDVVGSDSNDGGNSNNEQQQQQQPSQIRARAEQMPDSVYKMAPFLFGADIIPDYFTEPADRVSQSVISKPSSGLKPAKRIQTTTSVSNAAAVATSSQEVRPEKVLPMKTQMIRTIKPRSAPLMLPSSPPSQPPPPQQPQPSEQTQSQQQQPVMMMMMAMPEESANQGKMNNNNINSDTNNTSEPVMKEQATKPNSGMDHVLSSLELVVEAMKQQTMAMAMISGQMAAKSPEKQPDQQQQPAITPATTNSAGKDKDAKATLESFGEVMGGLRSSRQVGGSAKPQMASLILDSFGEPIMLQPVKGGAQIKTENDQAVFIDQQDLVFDAPSKGGKTGTTSSTTTTTTPTPTTTTTTTTTQKPTTTTTARPTTISTTTTTTPAPLSTSTTVQATTSSTTSKPTEQTTTTYFNPFQSIYKNAAALSAIPSPEMKGWRRVLPFDYYSMTQQEQQDTAGSADTKQPGSGHMTRSVSLTYPSVGSSMMQQQPQQMMAPADNYRSVSMPVQGYPGNHQAMMMMMNGGTYNLPGQQQQQQQQQSYMDSEHQRMMLLASLMQHPKMMNNMMQYQMANGKQMQEMTPQMIQMMADTMATNAYQHQAPTAVAQQSAMQPPNMMVQQVATTPSPMSMGRPAQTMQNMVMQMVQHDMNLSDEIPKPPGLQSSNMEGMGGGGGAGSGDMFGIPNMSKTSAGTKSSIKIGDRPQFDPSNFQLLIAADVNQQKKAQMMKLAQQMSSAMSQQQKLKQQQQQESTNQDNQPNEDGPGSSNDLSGGASEKNVQKSPEKSPQKLAAIKNPGAPEMAPQEMSTTSTKTNGFSILGGRFKITPHTQMLHWVLDPTKVLLQQALGTWMAGGSGGASQYQEGVPISQKRIPRRNPTSGQRPSSASTSKVRKNTTKPSSSHSSQASSSSSSSPSASSSQVSSSSSSKSSQSARNQVRVAKGTGKSTRSN